MHKTFITFLELFGMGFSLGVSGPCVLACAPVLVAYSAGKNLNRKQASLNICLFLSGRLLAYLVLGYLAGLSGIILRQLSGSEVVSFLEWAAGIMVIILGFYVALGKEPFSWVCRCKTGSAFGWAGVFLLGFTIGVSPCAPLLALLFEISLMTKGALQGMFYALFFGLGTVVSSFIVVGVLSEVFTYLPSRLLKSKKANLFFRIICALLIIILGMGIIFKQYPYGL